MLTVTIDDCNKQQKVSDATGMLDEQIHAEAMR